VKPLFQCQCLDLSVPRFCPFLLLNGKVVPPTRHPPPIFYALHFPCLLRLFFPPLGTSFPTLYGLIRFPLQEFLISTALLSQVQTYFFGLYHFKCCPSPNRLFTPDRTMSWHVFHLSPLCFLLHLIVGFSAYFSQAIHTSFPFTHQLMTG